MLKEEGVALENVLGAVTNQVHNHALVPYFLYFLSLAI